MHNSTDTAVLPRHTKKEQPSAGILPGWLVSVCTPVRMFRVAPLVGLLLTFPSLFSGYMLDDHFLKQNTVENSVYIKRRPIDYFNFITSEADFTYYRERGILLSWWSDPGFRNHFFRPVASLVHAFQFTYFAASPWIMHAGIIVLYILLIIITSGLLRRFTSTPAALGVAILLFTINDTHAFSAGWISAYNTLLCCVFGMWAFLMHDRWRNSKKVLSLLSFTALFTVSLLCSEGALALSGYLFAYALFLEKGTLRQKIISFLPTAIITLTYLLFYIIQGFGVKNSGIYFSLTDLFSPLFFSYLLKIGSFLFSQLFSTSPVNLVLIKLGTTGTIIAMGLLSIILYSFRKALFGTPQTAFFFTATILSIAPFALGPLQDRLLLWSGLGAAGFLAEIFSSNSLLNSTMSRITARVLLFTNVVFSLLFFVPTLYMPMILEKPSQTLASIVPSTTTVFLNTPWDINLWYPPAIAAEQGKAFPEHLYVLYSGLDTVTLIRTNQRTLTATVAKGFFTSPEYERFSRTSKHPFSAGDSVSLQLMTAKIRSVTNDGRPVTVDFEFKDDLECYSWMTWTKKGPESCRAPLPGLMMKCFATPM